MKQVEDIFNTISRVVMTEEEKARMKGALSAFMSSHPQPPIGILSPYGKHISSRFVPRHVFQGLTMILLIVCGGVSVIAQRALPGDSLYSVKVNVNEPVKGALAFSSQAKAEHESELAKTRLQEAADLSAAGKLTPETRTEIESNFRAHVENVQKSIDQFASENNVRSAVELNSDLASTLYGNEKTLLVLNSGSATASSSDTTQIHRQLANVSAQLSGLENKLVNATATNDISENQTHMKLLQAEKELSSAKQDLVSSR